MSKIEFDVNVATDIAIDVAKDVLPVWWMEVYPFRVNQSKLLLHAEKIIKGGIWMLANAFGDVLPTSNDTNQVVERFKDF